MVNVSKQLGDFLRQRREKMDPATLKIPKRSRRRTPGLRREEAAELAGISVDWYARLEQGRESLPSQGTVNALANALKLTASERAHLTKLAIGHSGRVFRRETVPENLKSLVSSLTTPAYVLGVRFDILFWNQASVDLFGDFAAIPCPGEKQPYPDVWRPGS
jgi:transcriptional regulator with XRE-family HTH domain